MTSIFRGSIGLERSPYTSKTFFTNKKLSYENDKYIITVNSGLTTDGASIPRAAWRLIGSPFTGLYLGPALIHDGLYASELLPREEIDGIFYEAMRHVGINYLKAKAMYSAVRVGGGFTYSGHTEESIKRARECVSLKIKDNHV